MRVLVTDLETDRVIALPVASHYYGVTRREVVAEGLQLITMPMQLIAGQRQQERVTLLVNEEIESKRPAARTLRHLAGTTAVRLLIGAPSANWENAADRPLARHVPDGLWTYAEPFGPSPGAAIEYDAGSYSAKQIMEKARTFEAYGRQYWGGVSRRRAEFITKCMQEARVGSAIFEVPWWMPPPEDYYRYPRSLI